MRNKKLCLLCFILLEIPSRSSELNNAAGWDDTLARWAWNQDEIEILGEAIASSIPEDSDSIEQTLTNSTRLLQGREGSDEKGSESMKPVVYRYFGRGRARRHISIPFILLGSGSVDHWNSVGKKLSSKGFNVMACELDPDGIDHNANGSTKLKNRQRGDEVVAAILDALRWRQAVLVACDAVGAVAALEAAYELAPDEVAGIVLCGNLAEVVPFIVKNSPQPHLDTNNPRLIDDYILQNIDCPFSIVSDGNALTSKRATDFSSSFYAEERYQGLRSIVIGGGEAPHRRSPEQFSWVLARFVEEKIAGPKVPEVPQLQKREGDAANIRVKQRIAAVDNFMSQVMMLGLDLKEGMLSPESLVVSGRLVAYALVYIACGKVAIAQYRSVRCGISAIQFSCHQLTKFQKQIGLFLFDLLLKDWQRKAKFCNSIAAIPRRILLFPFRNNRGCNVEDGDPDSHSSDDGENEQRHDGDDSPTPQSHPPDEGYRFLFDFGNLSV
mmetsp:Transcript_20903/g.31846  ORF Transcript_20903/g.31846 Transcript_20903/m.31846 type:complete len:497 (-) Transcript_20903:112-1602(-)